MGFTEKGDVRKLLHDSMLREAIVKAALVGWVGAWLGSLILGQWWEGPNYGQVYYVPAILGCLALLIVVVNLVKTYGSVSNGRA